MSQAREASSPVTNPSALQTQSAREKNSVLGTGITFTPSFSAIV